MLLQRQGDRRLGFGDIPLAHREDRACGAAGEDNSVIPYTRFRVKQSSGPAGPRSGHFFRIMGADPTSLLAAEGIHSGEQLCDRVCIRPCDELRSPASTDEGRPPRPGLRLACLVEGGAVGALPVVLSRDPAFPCRECHDDAGRRSHWAMRSEAPDE